MRNRPKRRPPVKQDEIVTVIRRRIIRGQLKPGDQLPTHQQIAHKFETTSVTARRAYSRLIAQGFVMVRGRRGTFVVEHPPHLYRFILAFPEDRSTKWVRFWNVLESSARVLSDVGPQWIDIRVGVDRRKQDGDYQLLEEEVVNGNLAGILFATHPFLVEGTPLLKTPGLPRVALMSRPAPPGVTAMAFGHATFMERAVDHLIARKRKRIAFLMVPGFTKDPAGDVERLLVSRGLPYRPLWTQMSHQSLGTWTGRLAQLLVSAPSERPDGLVIVDDNLVEHACAGLLRAGLRLPQDLDVVAHCNFPAPAASALPIARLGYDIPRILECALDVMARQRKGEPVAAVLHIDPQFEWEAAKADPTSVRSA